MKISMPVMAILVTLSLVVPYLWFTLVGRKDQRRNKKRIENIIKNEKLSLNHKELWNDLFIGIDQNKKVLIFLKSSEVDPLTHLVNLNDITSCKINKTFNNIRKNNIIVPELQKLDLELIYSSKKPSLVLNFFEVDNYFAENFEQKRAEKWLDLILKNCNNVSFKKVA